MRHINRGIDEQLNSLICPEEGLKNGKRGTVATYQQVTGHRRRVERIFTEMIDKWSPKTTPTYERQSVRPDKGPNNRRRRRGPRSM